MESCTKTATCLKQVSLGKLVLNYYVADMSLYQHVHTANITTYIGVYFFYNYANFVMSWCRCDPASSRLSYFSIVWILKYFNKDIAKNGSCYSGSAVKLCCFWLELRISTLHASSGMLFGTGGIYKGLIVVTFVIFFRLRRTWKGGQSLWMLQRPNLMITKKELLPKQRKPNLFQMKCLKW